MTTLTSSARPVFRQLVIPTDREASFPADLPRSISVQTSEMVATNTRHAPNCTRSNLEALLQAFEEEPFFSPGFTSFPRSSSSPPVLHPVFQRHAHEHDTKLHDIYRGLVPPTTSTDALKTPAATDFWALHFAQFWVDYEGTRGGKGRPQPFVDSFPLTVWACQPSKIVQQQQRLREAAESGLRRSSSGEAVARLQRKRLLKEYYSMEGVHSTDLPLLPSNGIHNRLSLDNPPSSSPSSKDAGVHLLVHMQKHLSAQVCLSSASIVSAPTETAHHPKLCGAVLRRARVCLCPGEPSTVRVPDVSPAEHQIPAADNTAGLGRDGLQEGP